MSRQRTGFPISAAKIKNILFTSSAHLLDSRPRRPFFSGRADNACTNLLGFLVRYVRTRGMAEIVGNTKLPIFSLPFAARTCHAWLARLTRARGRSFLRGRKALLNDFWYFSSQKSTKKEKLLYLKKTPHPSRFARHLLPLEKAGKNPCFRQRVYWIHARQPYYAGVQAMRARICSAFSCDMFARVVV